MKLVYSAHATKRYKDMSMACPVVDIAHKFQCPDNCNESHTIFR